MKKVKLGMNIIAQRAIKNFMGKKNIAYMENGITFLLMIV